MLNQDFLGRELNVGDKIVYEAYGCLNVGTITKLCPQQAWIIREEDGFETKVFYNLTVKVESEQ